MGLCNIINCKSICIIYLNIFSYMFVLGGSSGIIVGNNIIDICLHDSYYIVSHFHVILSLGSLIIIMCGYQYYQLYMLGLYSNVVFIICYYDVILILCGIYLIFIPMHILTFNTLPRRILAFPDPLNCGNSLC